MVSISLSRFGHALWPKPSKCRIIGRFVGPTLEGRLSRKVHLAPERSESYCHPTNTASTLENILQVWCYLISNGFWNARLVFNLIHLVAEIHPADHYHLQLPCCTNEVSPIYFRPNVDNVAGRETRSLYWKYLVDKRCTFYLHSQVDCWVNANTRNNISDNDWYRRVENSCESPIKLHHFPNMKMSSFNGSLMSQRIANSKMSDNDWCRRASPMKVKSIESSMKVHHPQTIYHVSRQHS